MDIQKQLFEAIKAKLPPQFKLADVLCDVLEISSDSAYRRIRGEKEISINELGTLCRHFDLPVNAILRRSDSDIIFRHTPLDVTDIDNYMHYMQQMAGTFDALAKARDREIIFAAEDIPIFHFMPFPELIFFKLYAWYSSVCNTSDSYEQFVEKLERKEHLMECYESISNNYNKIPSTEIWTTNTIEPMLRLLDYYHEMDSFSSKQTPLLLCKQLMEMVDRMMFWAERQSKGSGTYNLYLSPVSPENSFMLVKVNDQLATTIKLFTINSIQTSNRTFCEETHKWIENVIVKSSLISGTSARERYRFSQGIKTKVRNLSEKLQ